MAELDPVRQKWAAERYDRFMEEAAELQAQVSARLAAAAIIARTWNLEEYWKDHPDE